MGPTEESARENSPFRGQKGQKRRCPPRPAAGAGGRRPSARRGWLVMVVVAGWHMWLSAKSGVMIGWTRAILGMSSMAPIPRHPPAASPVQCVPLFWRSWSMFAIQPLSPSFVLTTPHHTRRQLLLAVSPPTDCLENPTQRDGAFVCSICRNEGCQLACGDNSCRWKKGPPTRLETASRVGPWVNCDGKRRQRSWP